MEETTKKVYERLSNIYDWDMGNLTEVQETFITDVIRETVNAVRVEKVPDLPGKSCESRNEIDPRGFKLKYVGLAKCTESIIVGSSIDGNFEGGIHILRANRNGVVESIEVIKETVIQEKDGKWFFVFDFRAKVFN